jgi:hypothetical protein
VNRDQFLHVVRVASELVDDELVVVGSQAVLGATIGPPEALLRSLEVDVYPRNHPDRADKIDGAIGDGSRFHETYGYYGHAVGRETVVGPAGWEARLVAFDVPPMRKKDGTVIAWTLSLPDLALAKLAAGREHDVEFVSELLAHGLVDAAQLRGGVDYMPASHRAIVGARVEGVISRVSRRDDPVSRP